ncbi:MAG: 1-acyl-sn-glycerol-3-phosphate acyltransferase [Proteobacteria bacterium]|nr:1-acyl-sn-glycerol-3-phosphate acyltransferase [Pseudomonadota bacterium]
MSAGIGLWLRSALFEAGRMPLTVIWSTLSLLTAPFPFRWRYVFISQWARLTLGWLKLTCGIDVQLSGAGHLRGGPFVVMCKHQSAWETLYLQRLLVPQVWVLKRELLWLPFFGWALALARPVAVDRRNGRSAAMKSLLAQGKSRLDDGISIIVFPEGTRIAPGERGTYHVGGALLATHTGYPVLPIAHNAGTLWPKNGFLKYPGRVQITIGAPIAVAGRSAKEVLAETERWIETTVATLPPARLTPTNRDT